MNPPGFKCEKPTSFVDLIRTASFHLLIDQLSGKLSYFLYGFGWTHFGSKKPDFFLHR